METNELKTAITEMQEATADFGTKLAEIEGLKQEVEAMQTKMNRPSGVAAKARDPRDEAKAATLEFLRTGKAPEGKDLQGGTGPQGGFAVPEEIDRLVQDQLATLSPVRAVANVVQTQSRDFSKLIGRRGTGTGWTDETGTRTSSATPELAAVKPTSGEIYTYATATRWMLEDGIFDIESWLTENIVREMAIAEGAAFVSGNGTNRPTGFLAGPAPVATADDSRDFGTLQYVATGADGDFGATSDNILFDLMTSLSAPYRAGARWMMNSSVAAAIRKLRDADGRSLWADSLSEGQPARLLGYPVSIADDMPDIASDSLSIAFGNFRLGYLVADRAGMTLIRDEISEPGFIKIYAARRVGGIVADSNAIKLAKFSTS